VSFFFVCRQDNYLNPPPRLSVGFFFLSSLPIVGVPFRFSSSFTGGFLAAATRHKHEQPPPLSACLEFHASPHVSNRGRPPRSPPPCRTYKAFELLGNTQSCLSTWKVPLLPILNRNLLFFPDVPSSFLGFPPLFSPPSSWVFVFRGYLLPTAGEAVSPHPSVHA